MISAFDPTGAARDWQLPGSQISVIQPFKEDAEQLKPLIADTAMQFSSYFQIRLEACPQDIDRDNGLGFLHSRSSENLSQWLRHDLPNKNLARQGKRN
jgi:hypothetical protein